MNALGPNMQHLRSFPSLELNGSKKLIHANVEKGRFHMLQDTIIRLLEDFEELSLFPVFGQ